jgi:hypothetical protein
MLPIKEKNKEITEVVHTGKNGSRAWFGYHIVANNSLPLKKDSLCYKHLTYIISK